MPLENIDLTTLTKISGTVEALRFTSEVNSNDHGTNVSHIAIFSIGNQAVSLKLYDVPILSQGDSVQVVGAVSRGLFVTRAYHNQTQGVWGSRFHIGMVIFGLLSLPFFGFGLVLLRSEYLNKKAEKQLFSGANEASLTPSDKSKTVRTKERLEPPMQGKTP